MIVKAAMLTAALLGAAGTGAAGAEPAAGQQETAPAAQPAPAAAIPPTPAQRAEALAFTNHPFVLGEWKVAEAQRPLMRCVQISSGTRTDVATGAVEQISKISNRCSFPVRFVGEVGKGNEAMTVCAAELRVKTVMLPEQEFDLPGVTGGNCFRDVETLAAETIE